MTTAVECGVLARRRDLALYADLSTTICGLPTTAQQVARERMPQSRFVANSFAV